MIEQRLNEMLTELENFGSLMARGQLTQPRKIGPRIVDIANELRKTTNAQSAGKQFYGHLLSECKLGDYCKCCAGIPRMCPNYEGRSQEGSGS